jgi:hypothetical protein
MKPKPRGWGRLFEEGERKVEEGVDVEEKSVGKASGREGVLKDFRWEVGCPVFLYAGWIVSTDGQGSLRALVG